MSLHRRFSVMQWVIIVLFGVSLACLAGVINGLYNLGQFADGGEDIAASFVNAKAVRATIYSFAAIVCTGIGVILLFIGWRRKENLQGS